MASPSDVMPFIQAPFLPIYGEGFESGRPVGRSSPGTARPVRSDGVSGGVDHIHETADEGRLAAAESPRPGSRSRGDTTRSQPLLARAL